MRAARSRRGWSLLVSVLLIAGLSVPIARAAPPAATESRPAAGRDTVVIGRIAEPGGFHPFFHIGGFSANVITTLFTSDVEWNSDTDQPFAQGVVYLPSVRDGTWTLDSTTMTLRWKLKPRTWHDGRPVTCGDYVFTHRVMRDERVPGFPGRRESIRRIANVVCPTGEAGMDVTVRWSERYAFASQAVLGQFWMWVVLPRHVLEPFYRASPSRLDQTPYGFDPSATVGDGPYRWVEWRKGQSLTVEAVAGHPIFGTPKIRRIVWRFITNPNTLLEQLRSGAIDAIDAGGVSLDEAVALEREAGRRIKVFFESTPIWVHLDFNFDNPWLQDVRVRRAIAHAINRRQIVQHLFHGKPLVSHSYLEPSNPGYTDDLQKYPFDPARARALLREVGVVPGTDGIMQDVSGQRLSLQLSTSAGVRAREQVQQIIQEQLRRVGIEAPILNFPGRVFSGEIVARRKFTMGLYASNWTAGQGCLGVYTSDAIPTEATGWAGNNKPGYASAEMDRVCRAIWVEVDPEQRKRLLQESAKIFARDLPSMPLYYQVATAAAKVGLENFPGVAVPSAETWNAATWYWR